MKKLRSLFHSSSPQDDATEAIVASIAQKQQQTEEQTQENTTEIKQPTKPQDHDDAFRLDMEPKYHVNQNLVTFAIFDHKIVSGVRPYDYKTTYFELSLNLITRMFTANIETEVQWDVDMSVESSEKVGGLFYACGGYGVRCRVKKREVEETVSEHIPTEFILYAQYLPPAMYLGKFMGVDLLLNREYSDTAFQLLWQPLPLAVLHCAQFSDCIITLDHDN
jgi:hypothetical protein